MKLIASKVFSTEIVLERSITPTLEHLGEYKCVMDLYDLERPGEYGIEWDVPDLNECVWIGIWVDNNKKVNNYDGVFRLPDEAIELLKENGFDTSYAED